MRPRLMPMMAAALVVFVWRAASDQAGARIVRDETVAPANLATEAGGLPLPPRKPALIPYSLIGAISSENQWIGACDRWSWPLFNPFTPRGRAFFGKRLSRPFNEAPSLRPPPWLH